jgi:hypothetical protein
MVLGLKQVKIMISTVFGRQNGQVEVRMRSGRSKRGLGEVQTMIMCGAGGGIWSGGWFRAVLGHGPG